MFLAYNFEISPTEKFNLGIDNRGFLYGDGFFETIFVKNGEIRFLNTHLQRLSNALKSIQISIPSNFTRDNIEQTIFDLLSINNINLNSAKVRIHAWRKPGGLYAPTSTAFDFLITVFSFDASMIPLQKENAGFYTEGFVSPSPISKYKSLNASIYSLGGLYMQEKRWNDIIFINQEKNIVEALYSNIWWIKDNIVFTPSTDTGCIGGVMQQQLFNYFTQHNITYQIGLFDQNVLEEVESIFTSNAAGIISYQHFENKKYNTQHPLVLSLQKEFSL